MVGDGAAKGAETVAIAKRVRFDGVKDFGEVGVERKGSEGVGVAEVFDVFGEVAEEEDVGVADFAGYLNLFFGSGGQLIMCKKERRHEMGRG